MWNEFNTRELVFSDREAFIVYPKTRSNGRLLFKTEYMDAFPGVDIAMLERGYHLIHIKHYSRWSTDEELEIMAEFVRYCAEEIKTSERCVLEGLSCGGLQAVSFAERFPELCSVLYLDAPVLNILSMAGLGECKGDFVDSFWREIVATYGVSRSTIVNFRKSPIDNMQPLIDNSIPIIMLYGNADNVVIYEENGKVLENFYKENGGNIKVIVKSMCEHHPHGLDDPSIIVDYIEKYFKSNVSQNVSQTIKIENF